jgi:archaellum component FlaC
VLHIFEMLMLMVVTLRADEIYNETKKDISVLRRLREELENANFQQPLKRMETNYSSRLDTVAKRIAARTNPVSPRGTFPLPAHPLFPDQADFNATLVKSLSVELNEVTDLLNDVNAAVESYRSRCKAIDDAVQLREEIACTLLQISVLRDRLENGFHSDDGDGSPPDLSLTECVEPLRSSSYLARLPSLTEEIAKLEADTHTLLGKYAVATLRLQSAEIDEVPKEELAADMTRLDSELKGLVHGRDVMLSNVTKLRDIRRIWSTLTDLTSQVEALTAQTHEAIGRERWKQHFTREELPPTPEGSQLDLPVHDDVPSATMDTLDSLYGVYFAECEGPFERMHGSLPQKLSQHLEIKLGGFREAFSDLKDMCVLLVGVRRQAASMASIRDDTHKLLAKVDELRSLAEELSRDILQGAGTDVLAWEQSFDESLSALDKEVKALTGSLSARVILLTKEQHSNTTDSRAIASKLPFNPVLQDRIVRHDANTFATSLNGGIRDLQRRQQYVHACSLARVVDLAIERVEAEIASANPAIDTYRKRLKDIYSSSEASTPSSLQELKDDIDSAVGSSFRIEEALKTACAELSQLLDDTKDIADDACQQLATSRSSSLERVKERHKQSKSAMETIQAEFNSFELSLARIAAERSTTSFVQERSGCIDDVESDCGIGDDTLVQEAPAEDETDLVEVNVLDGLQKDNGSSEYGPTHACTPC